MPDKYKNLPIRELKELLQEKQELYDDIAEQQKFTLSQTGRHLSGEMLDGFEKEMAELEEDIEEIEQILAERDDLKIDEN